MHISIIIMRLATIRIMARSSFSRCVYYIRSMPVVKDFLHNFFALVAKKHEHSVLWVCILCK